jgi:hypothetical protein
MAKYFEAITDPMRAFIEKQHMFFVASAPLSASGHINLSPKGIDTFRVLSPTTVAYLDLTGSGNETSAHLLENGRITFMFCAFDGPPDIVRLFGTGRAVLPDTPEWGDLASRFTLRLGARQIIIADISQTMTSCGYAVPLFDYVADRDQLDRWAEAKGPDGLVAYRQEKNMCSLDGLPTPLAVKAETAQDS